MQNCEKQDLSTISHKHLFHIYIYIYYNTAIIHIAFPVYIMTQPDSADQQEIENIYNEAIAKLEILAARKSELVAERNRILREYIKILEEQKIAAIRAGIQDMKAE